MLKLLIGKLIGINSLEKKIIEWLIEPEFWRRDTFFDYSDETWDKYWA